MESPEPLAITLEKWLQIFMRRSMHDSILFAKQNGLSMSQIGALIQIQHKGTSNVSCISDQMGITNPAASQLLERLVQQGFVIRTEDPNDRRLKQIALTPKGKDLLKEGFRAREKWLNGLVNLLSPAEQEQVIAAMQILLEKASQMEPLFSSET